MNLLREFGGDWPLTWEVVWMRATLRIPFQVEKLWPPNPLCPCETVALNRKKSHEFDNMVFSSNENKQYQRETVPSYVLKSFRFKDEDDYENEIFSILSGARALTNVILAGKCDSRRYSSTSFSENVVVAKTSYQMFGILSFCCRESINNRTNNNTFWWNKVKWSFPDCLVFENTRKNFKLNLVIYLVLKSKALY